MVAHLSLSPGPPLLCISHQPQPKPLPLLLLHLREGDAEELRPRHVHHRAAAHAHARLLGEDGHRLQLRAEALDVLLGHRVVGQVVLLHELGAVPVFLFFFGGGNMCVCMLHAVVGGRKLARIGMGLSCSHRSGGAKQGKAFIPSSSKPDSLRVEALEAEARHLSHHPFACSRRRTHCASRRSSIIIIHLHAVEDGLTARRGARGGSGRGRSPASKTTAAGPPCHFCVGVGVGGGYW